MQYPSYIIYASQDEVAKKLNRTSQSKLAQQEMLDRCEDVQLTETDGNLQAVIDLEVYKYLVRFLRENTDLS